MKALAVFPSSREVRLIDTPEPVIAGPTVRLRCSSTAHRQRTPAHLVIGHEALGEVIDVGSGVTGLGPATWPC